ncbi:RadC family protein [Hydrogenothermus marinus]|uniref:DNA repair protein RadC n=1 Tax=Hydrogenothermus marinus TaxID=133270 RepID=A0A3M0BJG5_9AQUI|nr:DNA repair protein RadC [Hydrogenothermus marinus]RMA97317.1 DNA repair protein RadC [Hydrogenothermus marinus]
MKFEKYIYKRKIKDLPEDLLPREKALKYGISSLSESELLALSLGSGTKGLNVIGLADKIIKKFGFKNLKNIKLEDLLKIKGIGKAKALQILSIIELSNRLSENEEKIELSNPESVYELVKDLKNERQEKLIAIYTNTLNQLLAKETIAIGSLNRLNAKPRDIFFYAIKSNAYGIILVHNHPEGDSSPSDEDITFTENIKDLSIKMGFELLDHLIISKKGYFSFALEGII